MNKIATANNIWKRMQAVKEKYVADMDLLAELWINAKFKGEGAPSQSELEEPLGEFEVSLIVDTRDSVSFE